MYNFAASYSYRYRPRAFQWIYNRLHVGLLYRKGHRVPLYISPAHSQRLVRSENTSHSSHSVSVKFSSVQN